MHLTNRDIPDSVQETGRPLLICSTNCKIDCFCLSSRTLNLKVRLRTAVYRLSLFLLPRQISRVINLAHYLRPHETWAPYVALCPKQRADSDKKQTGDLSELEAVFKCLTYHFFWLLTIECAFHSFTCIEFGPEMGKFFIS